MLKQKYTLYNHAWSCIQLKGRAVFFDQHANQITENWSEIL